MVLLVMPPAARVATAPLDPLSGGIIPPGPPYQGGRVDFELCASFLYYALLLFKVGAALNGGAGDAVPCRWGMGRQSLPKERKA